MADICDTCAASITKAIDTRIEVAERDLRKWLDLDNTARERTTRAALNALRELKAGLS